MSSIEDFLADSSYPFLFQCFYFFLLHSYTDKLINYVYLHNIMYIPNKKNLKKNK